MSPDPKPQFKVGNDIVKVFVVELYREWSVDVSWVDDEDGDGKI